MSTEESSPWRYDMTIRELRDLLNEISSRRFDVDEIAVKLQKKIRHLEDLRSNAIAMGMTK